MTGPYKPFHAVDLGEPVPGVRMALMLDTFGGEIDRAILEVSTLGGGRWKFRREELYLSEVGGGRLWFQDGSSIGLLESCAQASGGKAHGVRVGQEGTLGVVHYHHGPNASLWACKGAGA